VSPSSSAPPPDRDGALAVTERFRLIRPGDGDVHPPSAARSMRPAFPTITAGYGNKGAQNDCSARPGRNWLELSRRARSADIARFVVAGL
jgi:hypothetical protein